MRFPPHFRPIWVEGQEGPALAAVQTLLLGAYKAEGVNLAPGTPLSLGDPIDAVTMGRLTHR